MRVLMAVVALSVGWSGAVRGQQSANPACLSNEALRHYRLPQAPELSPDGRRVVFAIREGAADKGVSHLWWADTGTPESARQITFSAAADQAGESDPQWMPDGSAILFLAHRDKHRQIYRLLAAGGEASPLNIEYPALAAPADVNPGTGDSASSGGTDAAGRGVDVAQFSISPDGRWLAVQASDPELAAKKRREVNGDDAVTVDQDPRPVRLWLYSLADASLVPLTSAKREVLSAAWSRDSKQLAVVTRPPGNSDDLGPRHTVDVIDGAASHASRPVMGIPPTVSRVSWSPVGDQFAFTAQTSHDAPPGVSDLYVIRVAGGDARNVTATGSVEVGGGSLEWSRDGSSIYVGVRQGTSVGLARLDAASGKTQALDSGFPESGSFATNSEQSGWAFIAQASDRPPEVMYAHDFAPGTAPVRLSRVNPQLPDTGWARAQNAVWTANDGLAIHGLLFVPPAVGCAGKARDARFPLIVNVHGGPTGAFTAGFSPFTQWLLAQGWAVLQPNPRGSTGYGWKFAAANKNDLGGRDYEDVMGGVDWALAHQPIDPRRLGLYGYSYGGEMAGFVEGRTDRFAAIISGAPVIDQYSEYGTEDGSWYDRWFFGQPWRAPEDAWRQSPLARAGQAKTPFLLLQGQADATDPLGQSQEMYRALRQEGVPVELVEFPRESHGGLGGGIAGNPSREQWHGFAARKSIMEWFMSHFPPN